jgi:phosphoribosylformimino-5-aminoimidazole carboxamide ribotide isomerase
VIVFAAVDLQQGEVVQLVGGQRDAARVRWADPVATAVRWQTEGFRELHVIDLDAARGTGSNRPIIEEILRAVSIPVQLGGGIRDEAAIDDALALGATRVIVGTRAVEDPQWIAQTSRAYPGRIVVAADVRDHIVLTRGWTAETPNRLDHVLATLNVCELAAVLITDVGREGQMVGTDAPLFRAAVTRSAHPVFAAGGIANTSDLAVLQQAGVAGAVLGMALYTGAINPLELKQAQP